MRESKAWETIRVQGGQVVDELKRLLHEGNVRRVLVKQRGRSVAEFPVTIGVVGALAAPALAAVGALVAVLTDCSIEVERAVDPQPRAKGPAVKATGKARATASRSPRSRRTTRRS